SEREKVIEESEFLRKEKGIDKDVLMEALEAALISAYKKNFQSATNVRVDLDEEEGTMRVFARKTIVDEVEDHQLEISLDEAKNIDRNYENADVIEVEVTLKDFGRIAVQAAKQVVSKHVRVAERGVIYNRYADIES